MNDTCEQFILSTSQLKMLTHLSVHALHMIHLSIKSQFQRIHFLQHTV
jgi:hypothetical protein